MNILNSDEIEEFLFNRAQKLGHTCSSIKGLVDGEEINIAWVDTVTGDRIDIIRGDKGES